MNNEMLRQLGLFLGILFRIGVPGLIVWYNTKDFKWDHKYTKQAVMSAVFAFGGLAFGYTDPDPLLTGAKLFWSSVKDGILLDVAMNQFFKWDDLRVKKLLKKAKENGE